MTLFDNEVSPNDRYHAKSLSYAKTYLAFLCVKGGSAPASCLQFNGLACAKPPRTLFLPYNAVYDSKGRNRKQSSFDIAIHLPDLIYRHFQLELCRNKRSKEFLFQ